MWIIFGLNTAVVVLACAAFLHLSSPAAAMSASAFLFLHLCIEQQRRRHRWPGWKDIKSILYSEDGMYMLLSAMMAKSQGLHITFYLVIIGTFALCTAASYGAVLLPERFFLSR